MRHGNAAALLLLVLVTACGGPDARTDQHTVRDSAGIRIVENAVPFWANAEGWRISDEPVVTIGELDGPESYQFHRLQRALLLSDGSFVVANGGTQQLRFFDSDGRFLHAVGRQGGGPGEFEMLAETFVYHDTVFAFDLRMIRMSVFSADGTFIRSFAVTAPGQGAPPRPLGRLLDGSWALAQTSFPQRSSGLVRDSVSYFRLAESESTAEVIGSFPGNEMILQSSESDGVQMVQMHLVPFGRRATAAVVGDRVAYGSSDSYEVALLGMDAAPSTLIRRNSSPGPVTDEDMRRWEAWVQPPPARPGAPPPPPAPSRAPDLPRVPSKAAHGQIQVDAAGNLWVAEYMYPPPTEWSVFDPEGRWLGQVATPEGFRISEFGDDYLLGIARDELGIEYVRMYRLIKP